MWQKTYKYGVGEGFLVIWSHFEVNRDKNFFHDFLTPMTPNLPLLEPAILGARGLAEQHGGLNLVARGARTYQIAFFAGLAHI